jgi:hypothetical protein
MGALLNFLVLVPRDAQVASEMQVDIRTRQWCPPLYRHVTRAHRSVPLLARLTSEAEWLHGYFTDPETRAMGEGLV